MVEGMILLDEDMTVLSVNKSALKILGNSFDPTEHTKINHMTNDQQIIGLLEEAKESGAAKGIITEKSRFTVPLQIRSTAKIPLILVS